jgi:flagellar FliL protein
MTAHAMDDDAGGQSFDQLPRRKFSGKKLVLFIVLPLLLLVGGGTAVYFSGVLDALTGEGEPAVSDEPAPAGPGVFYDLPDLLVNLNSAGSRRQNFLKISVSIEIARQEDVPALERVLPRIIDNFQVYLRELRLDDLRGSAGIYRLREELLMRITAAAAPVRVKDVLFREMLVQ